jgi:hypothetical protein
MVIRQRNNQLASAWASNQFIKGCLIRKHIANAKIITDFDRCLIVALANRLDPGIWLSAALINPTAIGRPFLVEDRKMFVSDSPGDS